MAILRRLYKQGNSPVVSLPPSYCLELGIDIGDSLRLELVTPKNRDPFVKIRKHDPVRDGRLYTNYDR